MLVLRQVFPCYLQNPDGEADKNPDVAIGHLQAIQNLGEEDGGGSEEIVEYLLDMEADGFQPRLHIEAGAGLFYPGEVAVTHHLGIGVVGAEASE